jgi:hypothetical protein
LSLFTAGFMYLAGGGGELFELMLGTGILCMAILRGYDPVSVLSQILAKNRKVPEWLVNAYAASRSSGDVTVSFGQ